MAEHSDLEITLRERPAEGALRIEYTLTNQGRHALYAFTQVLGAKYRPLPHRAYTALRERPDALHLFLGMPPIPPGVNVCVKIVPLAAYLPPGRSLTDYIEAPVPVREWQPYFAPDEAGGGPVVKVEWVTLSTEYFREKNAIHVRKADEYPGRYRGLLSPAWEKTQLCRHGYPRFLDEGI